MNNVSDAINIVSTALAAGAATGLTNMVSAEVARLSSALHAGVGRLFRGKAAAAYEKALDQAEPQADTIAILLETLEEPIPAALVSDAQRVIEALKTAGVEIQVGDRFYNCKGINTGSGPQTNNF